MTESHRLFVGGLPPNITEKQISERFFRSLTVQGFERKEKPTVSGPPKVFVFVTVEGTQHQVNQCIHTYNQTKWMGQVVTMQLARKSYLDRLKEEQQMVKSQQNSSKAVDSQRPVHKVDTSSSPSQGSCLTDRDHLPGPSQTPLDPDQKESSSSQQETDDHYQHRKRQKSDEEDDDDEDSDNDRPNLKRFRGLAFHYSGTAPSGELQSIESNLQHLTTQSSDFEMESSSKKSRKGLSSQKISKVEVKGELQDTDYQQPTENHIEENDEICEKPLLEEDLVLGEERSLESGSFATYDDYQLDSRFQEFSQPEADEPPISDSWCQADQKSRDAPFVKSAEVPSRKPTQLKAFRLVRRYEPLSQIPSIGSNQTTTNKSQENKETVNNLLIKMEESVKEPESQKTNTLAEEPDAEDTPAKTTKADKKLKKQKKKKKVETSEEEEEKICKSPTKSLKKLKKNSKTQVPFDSESLKKPSSSVSVNFRMEFDPANKEEEGGFKFIQDDEPVVSELPENLFTLRKTTFKDIVSNHNNNDSSSSSPRNNKAQVKNFFKLGNDAKAEIQKYKNNTEPVKKPDLYKTFKMMRSIRKV